MSGPPSADDFNARLRQALESARTPTGETPGASSAGPPADAPGAPSGSQSAYSERLASALSASRGDAPASDEPADEPVPESGGPVGIGDYTVRRGDCMASIALDHGHFWETLWNEPGNEELKTVRVDPYCLLPGDRVTIPELRERQESIAAEQRHRFKRKGCPEVAVFVFKVQDEPRANQAYELTIDGVLTTGTSDPNGRVEFFIPPDAMNGRLVFTESGDVYKLLLGRLEPLSELIGVQKRLANLGFFHEEPDGEMSDHTDEALRAFQTKYELEVTGQPDEATRTRLGEVYHGE